MKPATTLLSLVATISLPFAIALPASTPAGLAKRTLSLSDAYASEEDGLFQASNDTDGNTIVTFTPFAELGLSSLVPRTLSLEARSADAQGCISSPSITPRSDIDAANTAILNAYCPNEDLASVKGSDWGWIYRGTVAVYLCPYATTVFGYNDFVGALQGVDISCGSLDAGGYQGIGSVNVVTGRTFRGDHFCTSGFAPGYGG